MTCRGQGEALTIDRRGLFEALFHTLSPTTLRSLWDGGHSGPGDEVSNSMEQQQHSTTLLVQTASQMLLEQGRALDVARLAAFAKRLAAAALWIDLAPAMGLLAVLDRLLRWLTRLHLPAVSWDLCLLC